MSRTDKTKPWLVRVAEHQPWAEHDHRDGVCDLPESPLEHKWTGCHWSNDNLVLRSSCCRKGCCRSCSGTAERKAKRKRERLQARRDILKEPVTGKAKPKKYWKNTKRWCKGKTGREHKREVIWAPMYNWRPDNRVCYESPSTHWRPGWQCLHQVVCAHCGKILAYTAAKEDCPIWQSRQ